MIRRAVDFTVSALPLKASLLYYAAQLPPALRSKLSIRVLSAINRRTPDRPPLSRTNLGIHSQVDCLIPNQHSELLFGAPRLAHVELPQPIDSATFDPAPFYSEAESFAAARATLH